MNTRITLAFSCINICWVLWKLFENEAVSLSVKKHLLRHPASVNAMKQTCVIVLFIVFASVIEISLTVLHLNICSRCNKHFWIKNMIRVKIRFRYSIK